VDTTDRDTAATRSVVMRFLKQLDRPYEYSKFNEITLGYQRVQRMRGPPRRAKIFLLFAFGAPGAGLTSTLQRVLSETTNTFVRANIDDIIQQEIYDRTPFGEQFKRCLQVGFNHACRFCQSLLAL
jgi:hypothetical protein